MQFTILAALSALSTVTLALPASSSTLAPRSCTAIFPNGVNRISVSKLAGQDSSSQTLAFTVPPNAAGPCSLVATFPPGFPIISTGNAQVNVLDVNGPTPLSIVGTITFASDPVVSTFTTINSFACRPDMKFALKMATEGAGSVSFAEGNGAGVELTYGC